jgi:hypothetical protein
MIVAGSMKFMAGKLMLVGVGSMALSLINIQNDWLALTLGAIAATIEILWGISFAFGCRLTSKWAALGLSIVMAVALTFKLVNLPPMSGSFFVKIALILENIRLDLLLFAVFFHKALHLIKSWCGMGCCSSSASCCSTGAQK